MADRTKSGGISTAKARRKDSAARNKALGLATLGRTKREPGADEQQELAGQVPQARDGKARQATYIMVEHRRRDSGAIARALDLTAPDAPDAPDAPGRERVRPAADPSGEMLQFAVVCVTHQAGPVRYGTASQARKEVKSSHKWCEACRLYRAGTPAMRNKATAQTRRRNG